VRNSGLGLSLRLDIRNIRNIRNGRQVALPCVVHVLDAVAAPCAFRKTVRLGSNLVLA
jgi:hypothetical protein